MQAPVGTTPQAAPQPDMRGILDQLQNAPDPQLFAQRFNMLMDQRNQMAGPKGVDSRGFQVPSKDQSKFIKDWMEQKTQFLTAPQELGGQGMTPFQARVQAVNEAKQQFPQIDPRYLTSWGQSAGPGDASTEANSGTKTTSVSADGANVSFGPSRAANITPEKVAEILTRPEFGNYLKLAEQYKSTVAGGVPSAKEFAKYVMAQRVGDNQSVISAQKDALDLAKTQGGPVAVETLHKILTGTRMTLSPQEKEMVAHIVQSNDEQAAVKALGYFEKHLPSSKEIEKESQDWFSKHAHELSVVAGISNFY